MSQVLPSNRTLVKAIAVFGGAQVFTVLAALVRSKVAAVTIGAAGVGLNAIYTTLAGFLGVLMSFGLTNSSVPTICQQADEASRREAIAHVRLLGYILSVLAIPISLIASLWYEAESAWLALAVVALVQSYIEGAVLRSLHATRRLSTSQVAGALLSVVCTVPFFVWLGHDGIIWAVVCATMAASAVTCWQGYRACDALPSAVMLNRDLLRWARPLLTLGFAFLLSGLMMQGCDLVIQRWFTMTADLSVVGLYKAGYQLSIIYPCMLFAAVANDYYPRLADICSDMALRNRLVKREMRLLFIIALPATALLWVLMPYIIPLILSQEFLTVIPMVRVGLFSLLLRALYLPIAYIPVASARSLHYLLLEGISWSLLVVCIIAGYSWHDFSGIGWGILLSNALDLIFAWVFCRIKYHFR